MLSLTGKKGNLGCNWNTERAVIAYYYPCSIDLDSVYTFSINYVIQQ